MCTHVSKVRIDDAIDQFLVKPLGLSYYEVTGSSLVKINANGKLISRQNLTHCQIAFEPRTFDYILSAMMIPNITIPTIARFS
jgi:hypothetical protein